MTITDPKLAKAKPESKAYRIQIGDNAYLEVSPKGRKTWRMRYRKPDTGKEAVITLGRYCDTSATDDKGIKKPKPDWHVSLVAVRNLVADAKGLLGQGIDPVEHKNQLQHEREQAVERIKQQIENSFENVARDWHRHRMDSMKKWTPAHAEKILKSLEADVFPAIGAKPIDQITAPELLEMIQAVVERGAIETAKKLNQRINAIYRYAVVRKLVKHNEAENLRDELPTVETKNNPYLSAEELPEFLRDIGQGDMGEIVRIGMLFTLHTLARTAETRLARWREFDFEKREWHLPAERMKMNRPHTVPLSDQVIDLLERLRAFTGQYDYLFVTRGWNKPMSGNAMLYALYRLDYKGRVTIHGLRGTGSTVLNGAGYRADVIESALAHIDGNRIRGAYNHADYLDERRTMMQWWSDYLNGIAQGAQVIPINRNRA